MRGKVVIVTGATKGIGLGIAEKFASLGARIVVSSRNQAECDKIAKSIASRFKAKAVGISCDMAKPEQVKSLVDGAVKKFGRLDIFVNNAGIYPYKPISSMEEADWDSVIDANLKGSLFSIKESASAMKAGGKIVIISSIASMVGFAGLAHYCASKAGVNGLVRAAALELAQRGITVNAIAPGAIETPGASGAMDDAAKKGAAAAIPLKRWGTPKDIAHAAAYLCSDGAGYVTGQVLVVDGGWTIQ